MRAAMSGWLRGIVSRVFKRNQDTWHICTPSPLHNNHSDKLSQRPGYYFKRVLLSIELVAAYVLFDRFCLLL
jgi:hypothetical protein